MVVLATKRSVKGNGDVRRVVTSGARVRVETVR